MNFENFTIKAQQAVQQAVELARAPKAAVSDADFVAEPEGPSEPTVGDGDFI